MLFRKHVSRKAARKERAILEGVRLDSDTIAACIDAYPLKKEEAVQDGLTMWSAGKGAQPPTWQVLLSAMQYAKIAQLNIQGLKMALMQPEGM